MHPPAYPVADRLRSAGRRLRDNPTDLVQVLKATVAAVVAWVLAARVVGLEQPFLAPWAALLTVHATVYRTFWRGAQSVLATGVGIVVSFAAVQTLGYGAWSLGLAVLVGLLLARTPLVREEGVAVATTALFVITAGAAAQETLLLHRFADTVLGVAVGLVVNVVIAPPLDDRIAERALERAIEGLGGLLCEISEDLRAGLRDDAVAQGWIDRSREVDEGLDRAQRDLSFTRESQWLNRRRHRSGRTLDVDEATEVLLRLEDGVAQARSMARVVQEATFEAQEWDEDFRARWTDLLHAVGTRVADPDRAVEDVRPDLDRLTADLSHADLPSMHWPVYGALLTATVNVLEIVDDVASHRGRLRPVPAP